MLYLCGVNAFCLPLFLPQPLGHLHPRSLAPGGVSRAAEPATLKYASWLKDYFELVILERPQRKVTLFIREIHIRRGPVYGRQCFFTDLSFILKPPDPHPFLSSLPGSLLSLISLWVYVCLSVNLSFLLLIFL